MDGRADRSDFRTWPRRISLLRRALLCALLQTVQHAAVAQAVVPDDFETIQEAIDSASSGESVVVRPGTYHESIVLHSGIDVRGEEAARTLLVPDEAGPAVSIVDAEDVLFGNFTVFDADIGVEVRSGADVVIANTIFDAIRDAAVDTDAVSDVEILNDVFWNNATAIRRDSVDTRVANSIFAHNDETIVGRTLVDGDTNVEFNCFFANDDLQQGDVDTALGSDFQIGEPLFVDAELGDFHLRQSSPCIDAGTGMDVIDDTVADVGAYGGRFADAFPFPIPQPAAEDESADSPPPFNVTLTWEPNLSYRVTNTANPGGYRVYYQLNASGPPYDGVDAGGGTEPSPIELGDVTSFTLADLDPDAPAAAPPELSSADPRNGAVVLTWAGVSGVTDYRVRYGVDAVDENRVDVGDVTTFTVDGLRNGATYRFSVSALAQPRYFFAITAFDNTPARNESAFSEEQSLAVGPVSESTRSNELAATPEEIAAVPDLPDEGCFIATAVYASPTAPEVQVLREFRDRYLVTHAAGRWLVRGYYRLSPVVARYLNAHDGSKPLVGAMLLPFVILARFMLESGFTAKFTVALLLCASPVLATLPWWLRRARRPSPRLASEDPQNHAARRRLRDMLCCSRPRHVAFGAALLALAGYAASAAAQQHASGGGRWQVEVKVGRLRPDLAEYERFYGGDESRLWGLGFAYRFNRWLEIGAETQHVRERGVGRVPSSGEPGGAVKLRLVPAHVFVKLRGDFREDQLFVPYVGVGAVRAYYEQEIALQDERDGTSDRGSSLRAGLEVSMNRLDPTAAACGTCPLRRTYLFIEAQRFSTDVDETDLGGEAYALGFRLEFGRGVSSR